MEQPDHPGGSDGRGWRVWRGRGSERHLLRELGGLPDGDQQPGARLAHHVRAR